MEGLKMNKGAFNPNRRFREIARTHRVGARFLARCLTNENNETLVAAGTIQNYLLRGSVTLPPVSNALLLLGVMNAIAHSQGSSVHYTVEEVWPLEDTISTAVLNLKQLPERVKALLRTRKI